MQEATESSCPAEAPACPPGDAEMVAQVCRADTIGSPGRSRGEVGIMEFGRGPQKTRERRMRVLIVEDEARLARNIAKALRETTLYAVDIATDGEDGLHQGLSESYDLIVLDLMLPKVDGLEILRRLRREGRRVPVLILTARDTTQDIIRGLDAGSDDYLTKPFDMGEFLARCKALVRRTYDRPDPVIRVGELSIDTAGRIVTVRGRRILLRAMEYRLLEYLALRVGQVVSRTEILEHLYDFNAETFSNVVDVYVSALRRKLNLGSPDVLIRTVRGQGYVLGEQPA